ncbi:hypothetical protein [Streptomyces sp. 1331.2]|uniref:hypothetical protein n=1 Tax=Streptomyces sp. 1331.2 TaxID=1938835 RepID=UPI000BD7DC55|nr:hypothetical protein [Streptomyces sp. 1331.2]SOB82781.1 hypothetical protein SAMN06272789_2962 [Streptomyces sp. 1331.2]
MQPVRRTAALASEQARGGTPTTSPLHRQYLKIRRRNRCHPVFSDEEWADVQAAASASDLKPGGYAAAVTVAAARSDNPEAAVADIRRLLEELMEADRQGRRHRQQPQPDRPQPVGRLHTSAPPAACLRPPTRRR